jgi:hypothetical protein
MANLYVTEFSDVPIANGNIQIAQCPPISNTILSLSSQSTATGVVSANTRYVRIATDTNCFVVISSAPTSASTSGMRMVADQVEYFGLRSGVDKVAAVSTST